MTAKEATRRAEIEQMRAETQKIEAERQRRVADEQKQAAIVQKGVAERQQAIATEQTIRIERLARDAISRELAAKAGSLAKDFSSQRALLSLIAWKVSPTSDAQALMRAVMFEYPRSQTILRGHEGSIWRTQFAPDGKTVVTAGDDATARLWEVASGQELRVLRGHEGRGLILRAQFSPDGKTVVTASDDKTARLWEVASGTERHVLRGHEGRGVVWHAQLSPDGTTVVTAGDDATARLWEVASGQELRVLRGHEDTVWRAQFAPDGKTVVTASDDKTARLWDVASGKERHVLSGHDGQVLRARFAPDGKTVVTVATSLPKDMESFTWDHVLKGDKSVRLWDVESGKELRVLQGHEAEVTSVDFAPDGRTIVTASWDWSVRLWHCEVCRPIEEIAAELQKAIGRDLTDEERLWYGVPEEFFAPK